MSSAYFLINRTLGNYKVLEHIGHGGMSEVYKGRQMQLDRMVAIKVLHPFLADEEGFVARFQREARIVATLRHPNIVQVYDFNYDAELGIYYMVMEYINGPTLKTRLQEEPLSMTETARVGSALADALDYAHRHGMIHRDIKPANIMFLEDDQPVLTDFGIAKMLTLSGLTASGAMVGTPAYMPPEVGVGKPGTALSDIYSLGVVLYHAVCGHLPFDAESPMGMVMQHIHDTPPPPSTFRPDIPPALEAVILKTLEKRPEGRYADAGDMSIALRQAMGLDTPLPVVDASGATMPRPAKSDPPPPADTASASGASLAVGPSAAAQIPLARPQHHRARRNLIGAAIVCCVLLLAAGVWGAMEGLLPPALQNIIGGNQRAATLVSLTEPSQTASPAPTSTRPARTPRPSPFPTRTPIPLDTPTPTVECKLRMKIDDVDIRPDDILAPGSAATVYVSVSNQGNCDWPEQLQMQRVSGLQLGAYDTFNLPAIEPDTMIQVHIPMRAPMEIGTYVSTWQFQDMDGNTIESAFDITVVVDKIPTLTPTPRVTIVFATPTHEALSLKQPAVLEQTIEPYTGHWSAVIQLQATGGRGYYRYYLDEIRADTEIIDGKLKVAGKNCQAALLHIWVISGIESLSWRGDIPYPATQSCP